MVKFKTSVLENSESLRSPCQIDNSSSSKSHLLTSWKYFIFQGTGAKQSWFRKIIYPTEYRLDGIWENYRQNFQSFQDQVCPRTMIGRVVGSGIGQNWQRRRVLATWFSVEYVLSKPWNWYLVNLLCWMTKIGLLHRYMKSLKIFWKQRKQHWARKDSILTCQVRLVHF